MSRGFCASAMLEVADATTLLYIYCSYNLNLDDYREHMEKYNGEIIINRSSLVEPERYSKRIRKPSGKKVLEERIRKRDVDIEKLLDNGDIQFLNSSGAWKFAEGYDIMALRLVEKIYDKYQEERDIPERVSIYQ